MSKHRRNILLVALGLIIFGVGLVFHLLDVRLLRTYEDEFLAPILQANLLEEEARWEEATVLRIDALAIAEQYPVMFDGRLRSSLLRGVHTNTAITASEAGREAFRQFVITEQARIEADKTQPNLGPLLDSIDRQVALSEKAMEWPSDGEERWKTLRSGANTLVWSLYAFLYSGETGALPEYYSRAVTLADAARMEADSRGDLAGMWETRHTEEFLTRESTMDMAMQQPESGQGSEDMQMEGLGAEQEQQQATQSGIRPQQGQPGNQPGQPFPGQGQGPAQTGFGFLSQQGQGAPGIGLELLPILLPSDGVGRGPKKRGQ